MNWLIMAQVQVFLCLLSTSSLQKPFQSFRSILSLLLLLLSLLVPCRSFEDQELQMTWLLLSLGSHLPIFSSVGYISRSTRQRSWKEGTRCRGHILAWLYGTLDRPPCGPHGNAPADRPRANVRDRTPLTNRWEMTHETLVPPDSLLLPVGH